MPFSKEIIEYHKEKIEQREKEQGKTINYETLISFQFDFNRILTKNFPFKKCKATAYK